MSLVHQQALPGIELPRRERTTGELIQQVIDSANGDPAVLAQMASVLGQLVTLRQSEERFTWEREERQANIDFDDAKNRCQKAIGRIAPNQNRSDTKSWWADYAQLDRAIRPIYTAEGFSISFSEVQALTPGKVRIEGTLSRSGISKPYYSEITPTTTGPKGNAMATATDADAIAMARAKRYILIDIFNIAVGIDKEEKQGTPQPTEQQEAQLGDWADALRNAPDLPRLKNAFADAYKFAKPLGYGQKMTDVYEAKKRELLQNGGAR